VEQKHPTLGAMVDRELPEPLFVAAGETTHLEGW
jgi:hypothetical protein